MYKLFSIEGHSCCPLSDVIRADAAQAHNEFDNIQYDTSDGLLKRSSPALGACHTKLSVQIVWISKLKQCCRLYLTVQINWKGCYYFCYAFVCIFPAECIIWNQTPCTTPPWLCPLWPAVLQHCTALSSLQGVITITAFFIGTPLGPGASHNAHSCQH